MPEDKLCRAAFHKLPSEFAAVIIGKMPVFGEDTRFQIVVIPTVAKHFDIVIRLNKHSVKSEQTFLNDRRNIAKVGADRTALAVLKFYPVAAGFLCVVRSRKAGNFHSAYLLKVLHLTALTVDNAAAREYIQSVGLRINGNAELFRQHRKSLCVVGVFVRDEHSLYRFERQFVHLKSLFQP